MTGYKVGTDKQNNYIILTEEDEKAYTWEEAVEQLKQLSQKRSSMFEETLKEN